MKLVWCLLLMGASLSAMQWSKDKQQTAEKINAYDAVSPAIKALIQKVNTRLDIAEGKGEVSQINSYGEACERIKFHGPFNQKGCATKSGLLLLIAKKEKPCPFFTLLTPKGMVHLGGYEGNEGEMNKTNYENLIDDILKDLEVVPNNAVKDKSLVWKDQEVYTVNAVAGIKVPALDFDKVTENAFHE